MWIKAKMAEKKAKGEDRKAERLTEEREMIRKTEKKAQRAMKEQEKVRKIIIKHENKVCGKRRCEGRGCKKR